MKKSLFYISKSLIVLFFVLSITSCTNTGNNTTEKKNSIDLKFTVSMPDPASQNFIVELNCSGINEDTINLKMPEWMPGYYQIMDYSDAVSEFEVESDLLVTRQNDNTWQIVTSKRKPFQLSYKVKADKKFVANSFLDTTHAYIVPPSLFMYIDNYLDIPVTVEFNLNNKWSDIVTGLDDVIGKEYTYLASDFDILYDCPILIGNLESLEPFYVSGVEHQFIGYDIGEFDQEVFMTELQKIIQAATDLMGDIPYEKYKFIGIGPGHGGIEHLNNTTVSFDGNTLSDEKAFNRMMSFLAHEYFHNYNVKRIRPVELGPFDYSRENKTNQLWISEGLTVYYEYIVVKRSGVFNEEEFLACFEGEINSVENDPGRHYQSLVQSSYYTWEEGPFGDPGTKEDRSISYYVKGPVVGLLLDFAIREATDNQKSLDDVMRFMYNTYYKGLQRGFTSAEFQLACEKIAGTLLTPVFEYVHTTKDLDYNKYLAYAGLELKQEKGQSGKNIFSIKKKSDITAEQLAVLNSWMGEE